jgi:hypothetical protein
MVPENITPENIEGWAELRRLLEEACRQAELPDPIELRLAALSEPKDRRS